MEKFLLVFALTWLLLPFGANADADQWMSACRATGTGAAYCRRINRTVLFMASESFKGKREDLLKLHVTYARDFIPNARGRMPQGRVYFGDASMTCFVVLVSNTVISNTICQKR